MCLLQVEAESSDFQMPARLNNTSANVTDEKNIENTFVTREISYCVTDNLGQPFPQLVRGAVYCGFSLLASQ